MAKNPYEAYQRLQQIAEGKRRWSDADAANDDAGRKTAHDSVAGAYDWLRGNGYADMAAYMDTVGADDAAAYAESKKPVPAYDPTVDARLVSEYLKPTWDAANAANDKAGMATAAAQGQDAYARMTAGGYGDLATALQGMGSGAAQEYTRLLGGSYAPTAEGVQRKSNDAYATGKGYGRDLIDASDRVYRDLINVNPMQTGYGRDVMRDYGAAADGMYDATLGAGIEAAGGNADSYGAAQANRNKAAVVQQGHSDVRGFYDSLTGAGNRWFEGRANALNGNLAGLQANVNADWNAEAGREANDLAARQAESAAATASEQAYYDYITALQNAETESERIAAEREFKAKEAALDRESKERIAEINAAAKGTTTRSSGTRSSGTRSSGTRSSGTPAATPITDDDESDLNADETPTWDSITSDNLFSPYSNDGATSRRVTDTTKRRVTSSPARDSGGADGQAVSTVDYTSLDYSPDEGVFRWNGKTYGSVSALLRDIENSDITTEELSVLADKMRIYGFNLNVD